MRARPDAWDVGELELQGLSLAAEHAGGPVASARARGGSGHMATPVRPGELARVLVKRYLELSSCRLAV